MTDEKANGLCIPKIRNTVQIETFMILVFMLPASRLVAKAA